MSDVEAKENLREYLHNEGYQVYPHEMMFGGFCDVSAALNGRYYAFEIKQKGDNISKGLKQLRDYSHGVHYCILVIDVIGPRQLPKFVLKGYGVWKRKTKNYLELSKPKLMDFVPRDLENTKRKYKRYCKKKSKDLILDSSQKKIDDKNW